MKLNLGVIPYTLDEFPRPEIMRAGTERGMYAGL